MKSDPGQPNMDGITISRLRYFHEVVTQGGVRRAAERLGVAPSSISRQLAQLEHVARVPLLEADRRRVAPTEAGKLLLEYYAEHVTRKDTLAARLCSLRKTGEDHVDIGLVQGLASGLIQGMLRRLEDVHPGTTVSLRLGGIDDIHRWIEEDSVHLGITYGPSPGVHPDCMTETLRVTRPLCAIVPPMHALTCRKEVTVDDMLPYEFALTGPAYGTRKIVMQIEKEKPCMFQLRLETNHLLGLQNFVMARLGITVLPAFAVQSELDQGKLAALPISHPLAAQAQLQSFVRSGRRLPKARGPCSRCSRISSMRDACTYTFTLASQSSRAMFPRRASPAGTSESSLMTPPK